MLKMIKHFHIVRSNILSHVVAKGFSSSWQRYVNDKSDERNCAQDEVQERFEGAMKSCDISNGMRLICECKNSYTTTVGCFLPGGAIYEMPEERGSALFLEHLLFRRTTRRTQQQLEKEVEEIGATIKVNATRDMFLFYGTVISCNVEKLIELFADVMLNGVICDEDVNAEKCAILKELHDMEPDYERVIMDYLPTIAYQDTELSKSTYPETGIIKNFCAENLISFRCRLFKTCLMTMVSSGSTSLQELQRIVCKHFTGESEEFKPLPGRCKVKFVTDHIEYRFSGSELRLRDDDEELGYVALGFEGPRAEERQNYFTLAVAKEVMGSWDRTYGGANHNAPYLAHCAFNTELCHVYKSFFLCWSQTSIWGCYFVCDKLRLQDMLLALQKEWMRLCTTITKKEVERAINQCKMHELMILNDPVDHFCDLTNNLFMCGCYEPVQERLSKYEKISVECVRETVSKYIYDQSPVVVALGRVENLLDYCNICNGMYMLRY